MLLALEIIGIIFMITLIFIAVWGFILANQAYNQMRYQNYLLEKITQNIYMLACKLDGNKDNEKNPVENKDKSNNKELEQNK